MVKGRHIFLLIFSILLGIFTLLTDILVVIISVFWMIVEYSDDLKNNIGLLATVISVFMYIKLRFWDTRLFNKLQKTYGTQKFIESLRVILELLHVIDPEQIIKKVNLISEVEIDMRQAVKRLGQILSATSGQDQSSKDIALSRTENKKLQKEISVLLQILNKKLDVHYLGKEIGLSNSSTKLNSSLEDTISDSKRHLKRLKKTESKISTSGKKRVLRHFRN